MLFKVALTTLVGALSVNALTVPVARSAAPEPESLSLLGRNLGYSTPGSAPGRSQFKREPSFELEIRVPNNNDIHDLASRAPEPKGRSVREWLKSLKEKSRMTKMKVLAKLKKFLGIGARELESEPKSLTKSEKEKYKKKKQKVANKMQKQRGANRMKEVEVEAREPQPEPKSFKEWIKSVGDKFKDLGRKIANAFKKKKTA